MAQPLDELHSELFAVRRSIRYHQRRIAFFERIHRIVSAAQIIAGTAAFGLAVAAQPYPAAWFAALVVVLGTIDLVIDSARAARLHTDFSRRYAQLERDMLPYEIDQLLTRERLAELKQRRLLVQEDEPPPHGVIVLESHNDLVRGTSTGGVVYPIRTRERWLGSFVHIDVSRMIRGAVAFTPVEPRPRDIASRGVSADYWTAGLLARMDEEQSHGHGSPNGAANGSPRSLPNGSPNGSTNASRAGSVVAEARSPLERMYQWMTLPVMGVAFSVVALAIAIVSVLR